MAKADCSELSKLITQIAMNIGSREDVNNLDDVIAKMQTDFPDIRRQFVVDAIIEATEGTKQDVDSLTKKLNAIKQEARTDKVLRNKIETFERYLEGGIPFKKKVQNKPITSDVVSSLRKTKDNLKKWVETGNPTMAKILNKRLHDLNAKIESGDIIVNDTNRGELQKELQLIQDEINKSKKQIYELKREPELQEKIKILQSHLEQGTLPDVKKKNKIERPEGVQMLTDIIIDLKKQLTKIPEAQKAKFEKQIASLEKRIKSGDILPKPKEIILPATKELEKLQYKRDRLKSQIRRDIQNLKPKTIWERAFDPFNAARALMTSFDLSALLRQGGFIVLGNPTRGIKAIPAMMKAFASERIATKINNDILDRDNAPLYARSKLFIAPLDGTEKLSKMEESYMSKLAEKIPLVRASERAYVTFLNRLRADSFDVMSATLSKNGTPTQEEINAVSNFINVATGRGSLGELENSAVVLNTVFFAPRNVVSRFQLLLGQPFYHGSTATRKMIAGEYAKYLIGMGVVYLLGKLAGGELEEDPRSSDFGKIRFGNTRLDPLSGLSQITVLTSRLATGQTKTQKNGIQPIRGEGVKYGSNKSSDYFFRFIRSKFSPMIGTAMDVVAGENVVGEEVTITKASTNLMTPLAVRDINKVLQDQGVTKGTALALLAIFGMGMQTYGESIDTMDTDKIASEISSNTYKEPYERNDGKTYPAGHAHKGKEAYVKSLRAELKNRN